MSGRRRTWQASDVSDDKEDPIVKKARQRLETLRVLRDNIKTAVARKQWSSTHALNQENVKFLVDEVIVALTDLRESPPPGSAFSSAGIVTEFTKFLTTTLEGAECFSHLHHFQGVFTRLQSLGGQDMGEGLLIERLAKIGMDSDDMPDMSVADVTARTNFRGCALYRSFVQGRLARAIEQAKAAKGAQRLQILKEALQLPGLPDGMKLTILDANVLFEERLPLGERFKHMETHPMSVALARDWDPEGVIGLGSLCMSEAPTFAGRNCGDFCVSLESFGRSKFLFLIQW